MSFLSLLVALSAHADTPRSVELVITQNFPYCGGAAPSPEILEQARTLHPIAGGTYLLREGATNTDRKATKLILDDAGRASLELDPGSYCLVTPDKRRSTRTRAEVDTLLAAAPPGHLDRACLAEQNKQCDLVIEVEAGAGVQTVAHNFGQACFYTTPPCYLGPPIPPPPSPAPGP